MVYLIIESGATKSDWLLADDSCVLSQYTMSGIHPDVLADEGMRKIIYDGMNACLSLKPERVFYYGTGLGTDENKIKMASIFSECTTIKVNLFTDITAAGRALFGSGRGIACILGTGSNAGKYSNGECTTLLPSLGYCLGDDGSGADIGKKIIRAYFFNLLPEQLRAECASYFGKTGEELYMHLRRHRFSVEVVSEWSKFAGVHASHPFIRGLVRECFSTFLQNVAACFSGCEQEPIGFVGSVAAAFEDILREESESRNFREISVIEKPIHKLHSFHQFKNCD